jgi:hypothetical protein
MLDDTDNFRTGVVPPNDIHSLRDTGGLGSKFPAATSNSHSRLSACGTPNSPVDNF